MLEEKSNMSTSQTGTRVIIVVSHSALISRDCIDPTGNQRRSYSPLPAQTRLINKSELGEPSVPHNLKRSHGTNMGLEI